MYQIDVIQYYDSICANLPNKRTYTLKKYESVYDVYMEIDKLKILLFNENDNIVEIDRLNNEILTIIQKNFNNGVRYMIKVKIVD